MSCYMQVGDFRINLSDRKKLGQGVHGSVYPGRHVVTNVRVAAKRTEGIYKEFFSEEEFQKEADLLLHRIPAHENIIKVYEFTKREYKDRGIPKVDVWLIMERCELGNLKDFAYRKALSVEQKIELMYQAALAVQHLHGCKPQSVAHRDVKPENLLVTGDEDNPTVKLCDFGSAKAVTRDQGKTRPLRTVSGTRTYEAPEQHEFHDGYLKYDKRVDIFSMGITFLALLKAVRGSLMTSETIDGKGLGEIMWSKHKENKSFIFIIHEPTDSAMVKAVKDIIDKMIRFEPSDRLSADEVVEELSKLRRGHSAPITSPLVLEPEPAHEHPTASPPTTETWQPGTNVMALHTVTSSDPHELSYGLFDMLAVVQTTPDPRWCKATDKNGATGKIRRDHFERRGEVELQHMPWYHGQMSWIQAQSLITGTSIHEYTLRKETRELRTNQDVGTFLVHAVKDDDLYLADHRYTLHVVRPDRKIEHYRIFRNQEKKLTINLDDFFDNLSHLVRFYEQNPHGLCAHLQKPLVNEDKLYVCVDSGDFQRAGWNIKQTDVTILPDMFIPGEFTNIRKGEYRGKCVSVRKRKDPSRVQDTMREAAVMSSLAHKNLVQLIGVCFGDDKLIITEFLSRGTLLDYLHSRGRNVITSNAQLDFARDVCHGMEYLEQMLIVHRHLAAVSVFLSDDGTAKIGDFVFAHPVGCDRPGVHLLLKWTAPEVLKGQQFTSKSDVWSFGVLLWEIYSFGCTPYPGIPNNEVVAHLEEGEVMELPRDCPDEIYNVMLTTWDMDPDTRPLFSHLTALLDHYHAN